MSVEFQSRIIACYLMTLHDALYTSPLVQKYVLSHIHDRRYTMQSCSKACLQNTSFVVIVHFT